MTEKGAIFQEGSRKKNTKEKSDPYKSLFYPQQIQFQWLICQHCRWSKWGAPSESIIWSISCYTVSPLTPLALVAKYLWVMKLILPTFPFQTGFWRENDKVKSWVLHKWLVSWKLQGLYDGSLWTSDMTSRRLWAPYINHWPLYSSCKDQRSSKGQSLKICLELIILTVIENANKYCMQQKNK